MKTCCRCGNRHIGCLIYGPPVFMFLFAQDIEQWQDENLNDKQLSQIRSLPLRKPRMGDLAQVLAMCF